ncbi:MAG: hypothetical protein IIU25_00045, partial [Oscillospiraceae bacterium]|nr:hypothetical protein [Oscillospiraceae bacterium]
MVIFICFSPLAQTFDRAVSVNDRPISIILFYHLQGKKSSGEKGMFINILLSHEAGQLLPTALTKDVDFYGFVGYNLYSRIQHILKKEGDPL